MNILLRPTLLACIALPLVSCGGTSDSENTSDNSNAVVNANSISDDVSSVTTEGALDSSNVVCGTVGNSFSYEFSMYEGTERDFRIASPVTGFGWDGNSFCDMDNSVGVSGIAVLIPETEFAPIIDGAYSFQSAEWATSTSTGIINGESDNNLTNNLLESTVSGYRNGARAGDWFASHDTENLFIRFVARNEGSSTGNVQDFRDSTDPRDDDSIDIYIDGDNSKGTSYDGVNDFHVTLTYIDNGSQIYPGPNSADSLQIAYSAAPDRDMRWYEIEINLASAGIVVGKPFGFEIQLNEDDNGGARDARFGWFEPSGSVLADSNPSVFGTVLLTGCAGETFCGANQLLNPAL